MENSKISWTDHTFNPWIGCTKVSPGCANCYAETLMDHRFNKVKWGPDGERVATSGATWKQVQRWNHAAAGSGQRKRVFVASLADVFEDNEALTDWRCGLWGLIEECTSLDFLLLTKRPENVMRMTPAYWDDFCWPPHVWIGTSVESQEYVNNRLYQLYLLPEQCRRFVSAEPLLGPLNLKKYHNTIDWLIVGGESGNNNKRIRPMDADWARWLRDWAQMHNIPFFMKQMGAWIDGEWRGGHGDGDAIPEDLRIQQTPWKTEDRA